MGAISRIDKGFEEMNYRFRSKEDERWEWAQFSDILKSGKFQCTPMMTMAKSKMYSPASNI